MIENEGTAQPAATPTGQGGALKEMQGSGLALQLNKFMNNPMDEQLERRFASMLLTASFQALVAVDKTGHATTKDSHAMLKMSLGVITYLADGQKYFPVFTDPAVMTAFMDNRMPDVRLRNFSFTTQELMEEVKKAGIAGLLVNPGKQSFPLTLEYWAYINHVIPVLEAPDGKLDISPLTIDKLALTKQIAKRAKRIRGVQAVWAANVKINSHDDPAVAIVVKFKGKKGDFERKYAPEFARLSMPVMDYNQDVLVGTVDDAMGRAISSQFTPLYEQTGRFGKGQQYD